MTILPFAGRPAKVHPEPVISYQMAVSLTIGRELTTDELRHWQQRLAGHALSFAAEIAARGPALATITEIHDNRWLAVPVPTPIA